ncbi:uncharacterized protein EV154DRAFT_572217 [Mucor mucedo]|uniref:Uncharacterized protein n=1 Tax=Mucor saturninus TaxID=64648 RepID=A0A8H7QVH6_9FUNG|nr:uncharacterized protein EV154DRAFT_572217 [Mucor mucedo]KAG2199496.1 hypothetical protein INT47_009950 [Mucor saturninus]KAI7865304.1 hypothetical protein EV154DRAFT_572217 [Mucor mucedo]
MPRPLTILAGLTLATALTYQSRINLITNTALVQEKLDQAKEKNDLITNKANEQLVRLSLKRPASSVEQFLDHSKSYYKARLVPSVKESWNAQICNVTSAIIQSDLPTTVSKYIARNVFGINDKQ